MTTGVTEITEICTKQDMSRWTRAHADAPGITWSVYPGPGGTMIIVEYAEPRASLATAHAAPDAVTAANLAAHTAATAHAAATGIDLAAHAVEAPAPTADPFMTRPYSAPTFA